MQSTTINSIKFSWPDAPCFVFNVLPIKVEGTLAQLTVALSHGLVTKTVTYDTPNGGIVDVREYAQTLFGDMKMGGDIDYTDPVKISEAGITISVTLTALDGDGVTIATHTFTLFAIWGALKAGERYNQHRTVTWFENYPFTVGHYAPAGSHIAVGINGAPYTFETVNDEGIYNVLIDDAHGGCYMTIYEMIGTLAQSTFDLTFDLTFSYELDGTQTETVRIRLVNRDINEGIYLRWIDRHGFWNYYLFKEGSGTRSVASEGNWYRNDLNHWEEIYHWQQSAGRRQSLTRNDIIPVCAPLVDSDTFDMLQDVTTSPCVDMYLGLDENDLPKWTAVTIEAGQYTKEARRPEQDFIMNVVMSEIPIQSL